MYKRLKRADVSNISLRPPVRTPAIYIDVIVFGGGIYSVPSRWLAIKAPRLPTTSNVSITKLI